MRRSICIAKPSASFAGEVGLWSFTYVPNTNLPAKSRLRFDPITKGGEGQWEVPSINLRGGKNVIWMVMPTGETVTGKEFTTKDGYSQFDFILPKAVSQGEKVTIMMGTPKEDAHTEKGTRSQTFIQRRRPFHLYVDPKGKGEFKDPETFTMDIKGNQLANIKIIAPSVVSKNSRFDIVLRFEDIYGNLTGNAEAGTLIELSYDQLRENLTWKLFVPETGFLTLPNLYFNETGIYRLKLHNIHSNKQFVSSPIKCFLKDSEGLYWGLLHGNALRDFSYNEIETTLKYFRDNRACQFYATSVFESDKKISQETWKNMSNQIAEFNEEERFVTFLGFQWSGEPSTEGVRHFIYAKDNKPLLRHRDSKSNSLKKIYKSYSPKDLLSIPCMTMAKGYSFDFKNFDPEFERVVEIYNSWGSSETTDKKGNEYPFKGPTKKCIGETEEGSIRKALNNNHRFGFIAGGLDKTGFYENLSDVNQIEYTSGFTGIFTPDYSRDNIFQALYNRRCYATTGAKIVMDFQIATLSMGNELNTEEKPGLMFNRHIHGFVAGTDTLKTIQIIRNGEVIHSFKPDNNQFDYEFDDSEPLEKVVLKSQDNPPFAYYYLKVIQKNGHIAWSSPIWIDLTVQEDKKRVKKK